jgi:putative PIN family toxin of toxin-antitoxin system
VRVVFDTNVFVSALVFPGGNGEAAVQRVIDGRDQLLVSRAIVGELLEVLARKFARDREELARVAVFVDAIAEVVDPQCAIDALADDADNRILECAVEGGADRIVTGDRAMLALGSYEGIGLVSLGG